MPKLKHDMETDLFNKRGAASNSILVFVGIVIFIIIIVMLLPYISSGLGLFTSGGSPPPATQGVIVSAIRTPGSVSPSTRFDVVFTVYNNINGKGATDINLCLDNLGLFAVVSSPNQIGAPQDCTQIPILFAGGSIPETFALESPADAAYENIPYTQQLGYFLNYSYQASASQSTEFVSQQAYNSNNYPYVSSASYGNTAGPVSITTLLSSPAIYGSAAQVSLSLANAGTGIILGEVNVNISMDSAYINMTQPPAGFTYEHSYSNGTVIFSGKMLVGAGPAFVILPVSLNQTKLSTLSANGVPYLASNIHVSISYNYEESAFFPITFNVQNYYTP